jgi:hypothetical protein
MKTTFPQFQSPEFINSLRPHLATAEQVDEPEVRVTPTSVIKKIGSNMAEVQFGNGTRVLISYQTKVAAYVPGKGVFVTSTYYSQTTNRHISKWGRSQPTHDLRTSVPQAFIDNLS